MVIRKAMKEDSEGICALEEISFSTPWSKAAIEEEFNNPVAHYLVAEKEGQIVGYVGVWCVLDEGQITNIAVHKDYRGCGIGRQLVQALISFAKEQSLRILLLEVRAMNEVAINLYTTSGFDVLGRRKNYYKKPTEDAILMSCEIEKE